MAEALKKQLDKSDTEVLEWITANAKHKRTPPEIAAWTTWQENRVPDNPDSREYFNDLHKSGAPKAHGHHDVVRRAGHGRLRELRRQVLNDWRIPIWD
jgi:hypothetical protein